MEIFIKSEPPEEIITLVEKELTNREIQVLHLASQELTNKEIAINFSISESTIRKHRENIYRKLGLKGKQAVRLFLRKFSKIYSNL